MRCRFNGVRASRAQTIDLNVDLPREGQRVKGHVAVLCIAALALRRARDSYCWPVLGKKFLMLSRSTLR